MRFLIALFCSFVTVPAFANDLPEGTYYLAGNVLTGIQDREIVPVQVHLTTSGNRLEWRFITSFVPDAKMCETNNKCAQVVQTLTHEVSWAEDGTLSLLDTQQKTGPGLVVDRAEVDSPMVYAPITALIDGALLSFDETGGTLSNTTLIPATLEQVLNAMTVPLAADLSFAKLDQCAIRQVLTIYNDPAPDAAEAEILKAVLYFGFVRDVHAKASYYALTGPPPEKEAEVADHRMHAFAANLAFSWPSRDGLSAYVAGTPLTDPELLKLSAEGVEKVRRPLGAQFDEVAGDILVTRQDSLLAALRWSIRYMALVESGADPYEAICKDVTLGD